MLRPRLALPLALLSTVALAAPALAAGTGLPVALPTETDAAIGPAVATAQATASAHAPSEAPVPPEVSEVDVLLAEAHERAKIAARYAHTAEAAKARIERIQARLTAEAVTGAASASGDPLAAAEQMKEFLVATADRAIVEAEAARAEGMSFAEAARGSALDRLATLQAASPEELRAAFESRIERAQARATAFAAPDPAQAVALAELAVSDAQARVDRLSTMGAPELQTEAETALAAAESRLALIEWRAEMWSAYTEGELYTTMDAPGDAPFRVLDRARGDVAGGLAPVTDRLT